MFFLLILYDNHCTMILKGLTGLRPRSLYKFILKLDTDKLLALFNLQNTNDFLGLKIIKISFNFLSGREV